MSFCLTGFNEDFDGHYVQSGSYENKPQWEHETKNTALRYGFGGQQKWTFGKKSEGSQIFARCDGRPAECKMWEIWNLENSTWVENLDIQVSHIACSASESDNAINSCN